MGQKIHPTGFRLAVTRNWASKWYAGNANFATMLNEDLKVREFLKKRLKNASVGRVVIERPAKNARITIFSSPFDPTAVAFLETLGAPAYKIASFELVDLPLIELCARTGKPLIMSTGMASEQEIAEAVDTARQAGNEQIVLLHCVSGYPTAIADSNLRRIPRLAERFGTIIGLSDHTPGTVVPTAATALGIDFRAAKLSDMI